MNDWMHLADTMMTQHVLPLLWQIAGALALWIVGGWCIGLIDRLSSRAMIARRVDGTLVRYAGSIIRVTLRIVLGLAVLGVFGIQTTSFAALLAAAGFAIGAAWSGLLSNFAAGVFLVVLKPFRVGDMIGAGGVTGEVREIGLFATTLDTADNLRVLVGNGKILGDNVVNYSVNTYRRVDLLAQMPHGVDLDEAIATLACQIKNVANVLATPSPQVNLLEFNAMGPVLAVRPFCHNTDYWQVYFDCNRAIEQVMSIRRYPVPATHQVITPGQASSGHTITRPPVPPGVQGDSHIGIPT